MTSKFNFLKVINIVIWTSLFSSVQAAELYQQGLTARYLGMGGTAISFARGVDALFYNPAALSKVEGLNLNLFTGNVGISKNAQSLYDQLATSNGSFTANDINSLYGQNYFTDVTAQGGLTVPHFGVGAYSYNTALQSFSNPSFPNFNVNLVSDYGYVVGGAINLTKDISVGVTGRHFKRWSGNKDIPVTSLIGSSSVDVIEANLPDRGSANAIDVGLLGTFQDGSWSSSYAVVWRDLGQTKFSTNSGVGPERQEDNLIFGASWQREIGFMTWTNALEYKYIRNEGDFSKKLHLGSELTIGLFDVRAGYYQGYLSYGGSVDLAFIKLEVATYTGELGTSAGQTSNPRYVASVSLNIDLDQSLKLQASDGKRRRLNQRR